MGGALVDALFVMWGEKGIDGDTFEPDMKGLLWPPAGRRFADSVWAEKRALCDLKSDMCI